MVESTDLSKRYSCDGANSDFPITFEYLADTGFVQVWLYDTSLVASPTQLVEDTDYTISADTVTTTSAYAAKYDIILALDFDNAILQLTEWVDNEPFSHESWEEALDKLTILCKWLAEGLARTVRGPLADSDSLTWILPSAMDRLDGYVHFDATTGQIEIVSAFTPSTATVTPFIETVLDDSSAAAVLSTLGLSAFAQTLVDDTSASAFLSTLGLSAFVQTLTDDTSASAFLSTLGISAFIQTLIDDVSASAALSTLQVSAYTGWQPVTDPGTGWFASKTSGWVADRFSDSNPSDCLTVDFSSAVPVGTRAVRVVVANSLTLGEAYWRKGSDANISNTPSATGERSHQIPTYSAEDRAQVVVWLSATYTADFAVTDVGQDLYIAYPVECRP